MSARPRRPARLRSGPVSWALTAVLAALALASAPALSSCGASDDEPRLGEPGDVPADAGVGPEADRSPDERVIRGWSRAVNLGEYERAASFFERGAIVEQIAEVRLATRADAIDFNRSLPCRADVTDVQDERRATLAAFRLREGRTGECADGGRARVRFVIRDGKIREWRQLPTPPSPPGEVAGGRAPIV